MVPLDRVRSEEVQYWHPKSRPCRATSWRSGSGEKLRRALDYAGLAVLARPPSREHSVP